MRWSALLVAFYALFAVTAPSLAAHVVRLGKSPTEVVVSQNPQRPYNEGDSICLYQGRSQVACGEIVLANDKEALAQITKFKEGLTKKTDRDNGTESYVELEFGQVSPKRGDRVELAGEGPEPEDTDRVNVDDQMANIIIEGLQNLRRSVASAETGSRISGKEDLAIELRPRKGDIDDRVINHGLENNVMLGINYIFPTLQFQRAVTDEFSIGIMPTLLSTPAGTGSLSGTGAFVTVSNYTLEAFHGQWMQLGVGYYNLSGKMLGISADWSSLAVQATIGWRWIWDGGINFGVGVGAQYLLTTVPPENPALNTFSGILPSICLDIGYAF